MLRCRFDSLQFLIFLSIRIIIRFLSISLFVPFSLQFSFLSFFFSVSYFGRQVDSRNQFRDYPKHTTVPEEINVKLNPGRNVSLYTCLFSVCRFNYYSARVLRLGRHYKPVLCPPPIATVLKVILYTCIFILTVPL